MLHYIGFLYKGSHPSMLLRNSTELLCSETYQHVATTLHDTYEVVSSLFELKSSKTSGLLLQPEPATLSAVPFTASVSRPYTV